MNVEKNIADIPLNFENSLYSVNLKLSKIGDVSAKNFKNPPFERILQMTYAAINNVKICCIAKATFLKIEY